MKRIVVISLFIFLQGCYDYPMEYSYDDGTKGKFTFSTSTPYGMRGLPDGDDSYSQGIRDGCHQALGTTGVGVLRSHGFAYDPNKGIQDKDYYRGYLTGHNYCTFYQDPDPL